MCIRVNMCEYMCADILYSISYVCVRQSVMYIYIPLKYDRDTSPYILIRCMKSNGQIRPYNRRRDLSRKIRDTTHNTLHITINDQQSTSHLTK